MTAKYLQFTFILRLAILPGFCAGLVTPSSERLWN